MSQAGAISSSGGGGGLDDLDFITSSGSANPSADQINFVGANGVTTSGAGNTVTITGPTQSFVQSASLTLTSQQVKNLRATPITLIAAPGAGRAIILLSAGSRLNYGGTNVFVAAASQSIRLYWGAVPAAATTGLVTDTTLVCAFDVITSQNASAISSSADSVAYDNLAMVISNNVATEISGNAANDNTVVIYATYYING